MPRCPHRCFRRSLPGARTANAGPYVPVSGPANELFRHRLNDPMYSVLTDFEPRISQVQDVSQLYDYDALP